MSDEPDDDGLGLAREIADAYRRPGAVPGAKGPRRRRRPPPVDDARRQPQDEPQGIADLLGKVVRQQGWGDRLDSQRIYTEWPEIVGPEVAQHAEVVGFEDAIVHVRASSTAWATQLRMLAPRLVAKLNEVLGDGSVLRLEVRGPQAPSWIKGKRTVRGRGPRDTYG